MEIDEFYCAHLGKLSSHSERTGWPRRRAATAATAAADHFANLATINVMCSVRYMQMMIWYASMLWSMSLPSMLVIVRDL